MFYTTVIPYMAVCFIRRDRKGLDTEERGGREKLGSIGGGKNTIIRIYCMKNKAILIKKNYA